MQPILHSDFLVHTNYYSFSQPEANDHSVYDKAEDKIPVLMNKILYNR